MTKPGIPGKADLRTGPLYQFLFETFPEYRTRHGILDVLRLKGDLKRSYQAVYNWLGTSKLTTDNAKRIVALANREDNVEALARIGKEPPKIEDLAKFVFA